MSYAVKNLLTPKNNSSGLAEVVLVAPKSWITTLEVPTAPFTNQGDEITIAGDHVFAASKGFAQFQCAPQKNQLDIKPKGDLGSNGQITEVSIFLPGSYAEAHEQVRNLMNTPLVVLVKDSNCADELYYQLGCDCMGAYLTGEFKSGTSKDGAKGYTCNITFDDGPYIYKGAIDLLA